MDAKLDARPSPIAGQWYPGEADRLASTVDDYISRATLPRIDGEVLGLVVPHAGYQYSGPVAGYAFKAVQGKQADMVFVLSPMHYPYQEPLLTSAHIAYQTPLGEIPVDHNALQRLDSLLLEELGYGLTRVGYDSEHSLEIELPFLQRSLGSEFRLVPIMLRDQNWHVSKGLGSALAKLVREFQAGSDLSFLLVASTDLSHFYNQEDARLLDEVMMSCIRDFNPQGLIEAEDEGRGFACGRGAVAAIMEASRKLGAKDARILNYATSGDVSGDFHRVVGYTTAVITGN
jgi:AmmeMemoRadiSam system protein B